MESFDCNKMNHVFNVINLASERKSNNFEPTQYINEFFSDHAKEAFLNGKISLKVHGECCLLAINKNKWIFLMRREIRKKLPEEPIIFEKLKEIDDLPKSFFVTTPHGSNHLTSEILNRTYMLEYLHPDSKLGKGTYKVIENGIDQNLIPKPEESKDNYISVEWVGNKHQGNVDDIKADHGLYIHGSTEININERTFENMQLFFQKECIEGFVFEHPTTKERFKCRADMFNASLFEKMDKNNKNKKNPKQFTSIKPNIII